MNALHRTLMAFAAVGLFGGEAHAACDAANTYSFNFSSQAVQTLAYNTTYTYTATNGLGATRTFTVRMTQNGLASQQAAGVQLPAISTLVTGANSALEDLVIGGILSSRTANIAGSTRLMKVVFGFSQPIRDFSMTLHDVDYANNQFRDWAWIDGVRNASAYPPSMVSPFGNGNTPPQPATNANSSIRFGQTATGLTYREAQGVDESGNNSNDGTMSASFEEPIDTVTFNYGNYPLQAGESQTGQQAVGIAGITFCPLPVVAVTKTSQAVSGTLGAFNTPSNDVIYTLTVNNTGGSPVDASTLQLGDVLPANVEFRNQAFDGTTTLPVKLVTAGGTTLAAANILYSQTGNAGFTYTPASGYDPLVDEIRITPQGQLAANSQLVLQFRARIK